jgi:hypothetical protein
LVVGVSSDALVDARPSSEVDLDGDWFQVLGSDAPLVPAEVVDGESVPDGSNCELVRDPGCPVRGEVEGVVSAVAVSIE